MNPIRLNAVWLTAICALLATVIEFVPAPQPTRILSGLLLIFFLPGFAVVSAALHTRDMTSGERLLATVGASVAITVCASVLLGATIGLSQRSAAIVLGGLTLAACSIARYRERGEWRGFEERDEWPR